MNKDVSKAGLFSLSCGISTDFLVQTNKPPLGQNKIGFFIKLLHKQLVASNPRFCIS